MANNDKISQSQLWAFIVLAAVGAGVFTLPRTVASVVGPDGWIAVIIGGLLGLLDFYIISMLAQRFPDSTLVEIANKVMGKFLGFPMLLVFWLYSLVIIAGTTRVFAEVIKMSLLVRTPIEIIILSILAMALLLARGGIEPIVRFNEITMPILAVTVILLMVLLFPGADFTNILPFMRSDPVKLAYASYMTVYSYSGFEFALLLIPFIRKPDKMFKAGITAFAVITILYTANVIITYSRLGVAETKELIWPTLTAIKSIDIPGAFVERLEGLAMTAWVLFAFTSIAPVTYGISLIPGRLFKHREFKHFCSLVVPIIYLTAMIPENVIEAYEYLEQASLYLGTLAIFAVPALLLGVAYVRKMGVRKNV